jgi:multisubunit Na+/H+ antiporter MnhG subunit
VIAQRRRAQTTVLVVALVAVNALIWFLRPDWAARLAALVVTLLAAPVLARLLFSGRR